MERNPAPSVFQTYFTTLLMEEIPHQLIGSLSHYLQGFILVRWCKISSINSMNCLTSMLRRTINNMAPVREYFPALLTCIAQESWIQISKANADIARPGREKQREMLEKDSADVVGIFKCSMYGIFTYIYHKFKPSVAKYSIQGGYGMYKLRNNS